MNIKLYNAILMGFVLSLSTNVFSAESASDNDKAVQATANNSWTGSIELGFENATGNVKTQSLDLTLDLERNVLPWRYRIGAESRNMEDSGQTINETYFADVQTDYVLPDNDSYWFGYISAEQNKFASVDQRIVEVVGYGTTLIKTQQHTLAGDIGLGARQSAYTEASLRADENEAIAYLGLNYQHQLTDNTRVSEDFILIPGSEFTFAHTTTALEVSMSKNTSLKLSYEAKHDTKVSTGFEKTDTSTKASIVFGF